MGRSGREVESMFTPEWADVSGGGLGEVFEPPLRHFRFPLQVGARYPYAYEVVSKRGSSERTKNEGVVTIFGWEEISVPAGKFRALKIEAKGTLQRLDVRGAVWQRWAYWYVPGAKRWVKSIYEDGPIGRPDTFETKRELELLEFHVQ
jgi:hypothetical protein